MMAADRPPNVLLILTDDQGYGDLSVHGHPHLRTPNLDRLASESVQFERFYVSPVCTPTRASLMTGRWWPRTGVSSVTHGRETMRLDEVTIAEALRSGGYRTGLFGKWHLGEHYPHTPNGQGFDEFLGMLHGHINGYFDATLDHNGKPRPTRGYVADVLTNEAIGFIERHRDRPFFCYLSYNTPHSPFQVPDEYFDAYKAMGLDDETASALAMCANIDANVGRVLGRLSELELAQNTIVLFLTDNGPGTDRYNAGMRGRKGSLHEGGVRVPLFVRWPGKLAPGVVGTIADAIDVYPTLLELCGISPPPGPPLDGRSLVPLMRGEESGWPDRMLFTQRLRAPRPALGGGAVRTQRYRLVIDAGKHELYDMIEDPSQKRDIAGEFRPVVAELRAAYERWFADVAAGSFDRPAVQVGHAQEDPVELAAHRASFEGGVRFYAQNGFAHDWLVGWTTPADRIAWEIDVVRAGAYEVTLRYACPEDSAGSVVHIKAGASRLLATVPPAEPQFVPLPHRVAESETTHKRVWYDTLKWAELHAGQLDLADGPQKLELSAQHVSSGQVMWLKGVSLRRVP